MGSRPLGRNRLWIRQGLWLGVIGFFASVIVTLLSEAASRVLNMGAAAVVLVCIIAVGVLFDIVGIAVASADPVPFNAMAAKRVAGARHALRLVRNAGRVTAICNDVVGDIAGIVSGAAGAAIAIRLYTLRPALPEVWMSVGVVSLTAALAIGGKAWGKSFGIHSSTMVTLRAGVVLKWLEDKLGLVLFADSNGRRRGN